MQLSIGSDVFTDAMSLPHLIGILRCVQDGRHVWIAEETELEAAETYMRAHVPHLADSYVGLAQKGVVELQWIGSIEKPAVISIQADDLVHDLSRPAVLVVEDQRSDGSFLKGLFDVFGAERLLDALSKGWLEIRHGGGGGSLPAVTLNEVGYFRRQIRVAALLDSDRLLPGEHTDAHHKAALLATHGVVSHVLELREIENYLPNHALAAVRPMRVSRYRLRFLRRLTLEQRGVYDMKSGFGPASSPPSIPPRQAPLFSSLPRETLNGLRGGFGKSVASCMTLMATSLTERDFRGLGDLVVTEIKTMLQDIAKII
jgi:hypothetical protein